VLQRVLQRCSSTVRLLFICSLKKMGNQKSGSGYFSAELMPVVLKFATALLKCRVDDMLSFGRSQDSLASLL
jgi:hypothetical protein